MPFLGMLVLYYSGLVSGFNPYLIGDSKTFVYQLFGMQFLFTCFIPCLSIYVLLKLGHISDIHLPSREERYLPFLLSLMSCTGYTVICIRFYSESIPPILIFFILGASIGVFFSFMISLFWKISIHMAGIGGFTGMMLTMANLYQTDLTWVYIGIITAGLVGFSRLQMNAHSIKQVALGFALGILSETYILFLT
jgi:membrane-associated phospholipid phosphatase